MDACGALFSALSLAVVLPGRSAELGPMALAFGTLAVVACMYLLFDVASLTVGPRRALFALGSSRSPTRCFRCSPRPCSPPTAWT
jgi:hypothetical protein